MKDKRQQEVEIEERYKVEPGKFDITKAAHPFTCIFHLFFKAVAVIAFIFMGLFTRSSIVIFVTVLMCSALDFWLVKNVTGR